MQIYKIIWWVFFCLRHAQERQVVIGLSWIECYSATLCHYKIDVIVPMESIKSEALN